ncbi:MAG: RNA polymerase sigma factor FliA [Xanthomonadaceae bacterium]|nr:RNA polymerase sigma factor FliA [Xanthomonadaceae bacterium]
MNPHAMYVQVQRQGGNDLVVEHAPLVKRIAHHMAARLPASVQIDDLIQAGMIGLLEAARQYDASQGASFSTYAGIRIRGAMLDEIRRLDWTPRSVHRKAREVARAIQEIENETGREAEDAEVAERLGISLNEYHQILQDSAAARVFNIDQEDPESGLVAEHPSDEPSPAAQLHRQQLQELLAQAIAALPERERLIMQLYYDEELNLKEIGAVLGVSESRVSQIHGRILLKLREQMADWV